MYLTRSIVVLSLAWTGACGGGRAVSAKASSAPESAAYGVPNSHERFETLNALVKEKLNTSLLPAMRKHGVDMWIVLDRENNFEPLHGELGGAYSGVRAAFVFFDHGATVPEKIYFGSHEQPANSVIAQTYDEKTYYGY